MWEHTRTVDNKGGCTTDETNEKQIKNRICTSYTTACENVGVATDAQTGLIKGTVKKTANNNSNSSSREKAQQKEAVYERYVRCKCGVVAVCCATIIRSLL